jgi:cell wall-associated NlpC family hydrolase
MIQAKIAVSIVWLLALTACSWVELPPPRGNTRDVIVDESLAQLDRPYRDEGADPTGFDASGLAQYVFGRGGIVLPRSAEAQRAQGTAISFDQARRGDLLFYQLEESSYRQLHVGIYLGRSRMVHVPENGRVRIEVIETLYWQRRLVDAVSYLP